MEGSGGEAFGPLYRHPEGQARPGARGLMDLLADSGNAQCTNRLLITFFSLAVVGLTGNLASKPAWFYLQASANTCKATAHSWPSLPFKPYPSNSSSSVIHSSTAFSGALVLDRILRIDPPRPRRADPARLESNSANPWAATSRSGSRLALASFRCLANPP